jgi:pyruvate kinase
MIGTKIVATVGPASQSSEILEALISAGANAFRFNLKHNTREWHVECIKRIREASSKLCRPVAIFVDIPGIEKAGEWLDLATGEDIDYIALSYIRSVEDVAKLRDELNQRQSRVRLISKIETAEAMTHVEDIIHVSDGIMVARGDLGIELPVEEIPYHQKRIIKLCLETGKPVITATEMLESMIRNPGPTRAEVSDVANAMYDLTDAVMLSAESAVGQYPREAVSMLRSVANFIDEKRPVVAVSYQVKNQTDALTIAANDLAKQHVLEAQKISAFVIITETGETARSLSRLRPSIPIVTITRHEIVRNQLLLVWGVVPLLFSLGNEEKDVQIGNIRDMLKASGAVVSGSHVIMIYGNETGVPGNTNVIRIEEV